MAMSQETVNALNGSIPSVAAAAEVINALNTTAAALADGGLLKLGTDNDQVLVNRATTLNAATTLTGVVVGTPVTAAIPANSLIVSNITADGDQVFMAQTGGNSQEWLRYDASAKLVVINEASGDVDVRVETDGNANGLVIDAGTNSVAIGSAVVAGAALSISNLTGHATVTSVGVRLHQPAGTFNDTAGAATIAVMADEYVGIVTHTATNARTYSIAAGVYIAGAPVASTNVTQTLSYALMVAGGISRFDGTVQLGIAGTTTGVMNIQGATSGVVTLTVAAAAGTWTLTLPQDDGDAGEQLQTNGSGVTTWEAAGSLRAVKNVIDVLSNKADEALSRLLGVEVYAFTYKPEGRPTTGDYVTQYTGVMAEELPEVMHHNGRIFSPVSAFGMALLAIKALNAKIENLEARLLSAGLQ